MFCAQSKNPHLTALFPTVVCDDALLPGHLPFTPTIHPALKTPSPSPSRTQKPRSIHPPDTPRVNIAPQPLPHRIELSVPTPTPTPTTTGDAPSLTYRNREKLTQSDIIHLTDRVFGSVVPVLPSSRLLESFVLPSVTSTLLDASAPFVDDSLATSPSTIILAPVDITLPSPTIPITLPLADNDSQSAPNVTPVEVHKIDDTRSKSGHTLINVYWALSTFILVSFWLLLAIWFYRRVSCFAWRRRCLKVEWRS